MSHVSDRYNQFQRAWANWLKATIRLLFSLFLISEDLPKEEEDQLWNIISKVVSTGPGPVNISVANRSHVSNKSLFFWVNSQWYIAIPSHETILVADPHRNKTNVTGVADDLDREFLLKLLSQLTEWHRAYWEAKAEE